MISTPKSKIRVPSGPPESTGPYAQELEREIAERKRVEAERDRLFSTSLDMMGVARFDGYFKDVNPAFETVLGFPAAELLERPFLDFVHPDDRAATLAEMEKLSTGALSLNFQNRYLCSNGAYKWLDWKAVPVVEEGLIYAVARDMTERKQIEEDLQQSQMLLAEAQKTAHLGSWQWEIATGKTIWTDELYRIFGFEPGQIQPSYQAYLNLVHPDDRHRVSQALERALEEAGTFSHDYRAVRPDGTEWICYAQGRVVTDETSKPILMIGTAQDITERKAAENDIRSLNETLENRVIERTSQLQIANHDLASEVVERQRVAERISFLVEASTELASSLDYETTLTRVARISVPQIADWCNVDIVDENGDVQRVALAHADPAKEAMAYDYLRRFPARPNSDAGVNLVMRTLEPILVPRIDMQMLEASAPGPEQIELFRKFQPTSAIIVPLVAPGAQRRALGAISLLTAESGHIYGPEDLVLAEEVARRAAIAVENARLFKQAEKARSEAELVGEQLKQTVSDLERSNTDLQQFAYVASHDLQEPLRMVSSYTQLLSRRYKGKLDQSADDYIGFAVDGANRMQRLINDLLAYSRVSTQGKAFQLTDCEAALDQALANLRIALAESKAVITRDPLPIVMGDDIQLVQLFQNLIGNAIKFRGEEPTTIHIGLDQKETEWLFYVRDNGIGMDPQYADRIFVIFQRLHSKQEYPGTGIGLSVCKKVVERHGGRIWVESQPGQGSIFYFTILNEQGLSSEASRRFIPGVSTDRRNREIPAKLEA
jgi:PAS domain S-box-containing protein